MPIIESFSVDHTKMKAPAVRLSKKLKTKLGDVISVFDLRFCQPNQAMLPEKGAHTLEHLMANFIRQHLNNDNYEVIDISPMGCRTGFYMSVIGEPSEEEIVASWKSTMYSILSVRDLKDVPGVNKYQCGSWQFHSLVEAHDIASAVLSVGIGINQNDDLKLDETLIKNTQI